MSLVAEVDVARMYSAPEVAAILKRSERTLATWRLSGCGPRYSRRGLAGEPVYLGLDLLHWLETHSIEIPAVDSRSLTERYREILSRRIGEEVATV